MTALTDPDDATLTDIHEPYEPLPRTSDQASRERRRFWHLIDPWAPVPDWYVAGQCVGCGGRNGHGGGCVYLGGAA